MQMVKMIHYGVLEREVGLNTGSLIFYQSDISFPIGKNVGTYTLHSCYKFNEIMFVGKESCISTK